MAAPRSPIWRGACRRASGSCAGSSPPCRKAATTGSTSARSRSAISPSTRKIRRGPTSTRYGASRCSSCARSRTATRVRIGLQALGMGIPTGYPEYVLHQMVTVMKGGEEMRLSKRAGSYLTLRELVDEVGRDAVRYFFLMRRGDSHLVFDVDLAKSQTEENPVFYVQMAHARMSGIFRVAGRAPDAVGPPGDADVAMLDEPEEFALMKELAEFPAIVAGAAQALEPHRVTGYLEALARIAHAWYHKYRVLNEPEEAARLVLAAAVRQVLGNGLRLLGISAPDRM